MKIVKLMGKDYIAGMQWVDMASLNPKKSEFLEILKEYGRSERSPQGVFIVGASKSSAVLGFFNQGEKPTKVKSYSLAATLASGAKDGIYIAKIEGEDRLWMFVTKDAVVSPNTDVFMDENSLRSRVDIILSIMPDLSVFTEDELFKKIYSGETWSIADAIKKSKPKLISSLGRDDSNLLVLAGGVVTMIAVATSIMVFGGKPKIDAGLTPEESAALARASYITSLQAITTNVVPMSSSWVDEALSIVESRYAVNRYGWSFQGANCDTSACNLIYAANEGEPRSIASLAESIGIPKENVVVTNRGLGLQFSSPLKKETQFATLTEQSIKDLPAASEKQAAWNQFVGLAAFRDPVSKPSVEISIEDYSMMVPPPPDMPGVIKGTITIKGEIPKDIQSTKANLTTQGAQANRLVFSYGTGLQQAAAWHIEYVFFGRK